MSLSVFAGSSQFIALGLVTGHAGMLVIWFATLIVNLRHMLYAATLALSAGFSAGITRNWSPPWRPSSSAQRHGGNC